MKTEVMPKFCEEFRAGGEKFDALSAELASPGDFRAMYVRRDNLRTIDVRRVDGALTVAVAGFMTPLDWRNLLTREAWEAVYGKGCAPEDGALDNILTDALEWGLDDNAEAWEELGHDVSYDTIVSTIESLEEQVDDDLGGMFYQLCEMCRHYKEEAE